QFDIDSNTAPLYYAMLMCALPKSTLRRVTALLCSRLTMTDVRVGASSQTIQTAVTSNDSALRLGWAAIDARRPTEAERAARAVLSGHRQHAGALHLLGLALLIQ